MYASESRSIGQRKSTREWNPMRDDYENSRTGSQMNERDKRDIPLDHCRLHVTNIPITINEQGLNAVFSKYGNLVECYLSHNPQLRYALIKYNSPGEAKMAMAQLNAAEPMRLRIQIARRSNTTKNNSENHDDTASVISMSCPSVKHENNNENKEPEYRDLDSACDELDNIPLEEEDVDVAVELQRLRMQELKVRYLKERQQLRAITSKAGQTSSSKSVMAEDIDKAGNGDKAGNVDKERSTERVTSRTSDAGSNADTSAYIQREPSRLCFNCGINSNYYCAQCKITPYCSEHCQQNDWRVRHENVCRNLKPVCSFGDENTSKDDSESDGCAAIVCGQLPSKQAIHRSARSSSRGSRYVPSKPFPQLRRPYVSKESNPTQKRYQGDGGGRFSKPQNNSDQENLTSYPAGGETTISSRSGRPAINNRFNRTNDRRDAPAGPRKLNSNSASKPAPAVNDDEDWELEETKTAPVKASAPEPKIAAPKPAEVIPPAPVVTPKVAPVRQSAPVVAPVVAKPLVPKKYLVETLNIGDQVVLTVEKEARDCAMDGGGYVCLSIHETAAVDFDALIDAYKDVCDADSLELKVQPGDSFSYYKVEDGYWYRARCLTADSAALVDSAVVATLGPDNRPRRLPDKYTGVPEFCCVLAGVDLQLGDNLLCRIIAKESAGVRVGITPADGGDQVERSGLITRWVPKVAVAAAENAVVIPTPPRPALVNNTDVIIVNATDLKRVFVLPKEMQRLFDKTVYNVAVCGQTAGHLTDPPSKGDLVLALYVDDVYYRALVCRTNVKADKYLVEYVDYGNTQITSIEKLRVCPDNLSTESCEPLVSQVEIACEYSTVPAALAYLDKLKDVPEDLKLTLPDNAASAPSGSAAILTVTKNNENVNSKVLEMCTPEWKKMELRGEDILNAKIITLEDVEYSTLVGPELLVLGTMFLNLGQIHACANNDQHMAHVFGDLSGKFQQYCESKIGGKPYKPRVDELCFCKLDGKWVRAVMVEHHPGESHGQVFCIDHAVMHLVTIQDMRKMVAEFVKGVPAVACEVQIKDYPADESPALVAKAKKFMGITDNSPRGSLRVERISHDDITNMYLVEAPALIRALTQ